VLVLSLLGLADREETKRGRVTTTDNVEEDLLDLRVLSVCVKGV